MRDVTSLSRPIAVSDTTVSDMKTNAIYCGNAANVLTTFPSDSIDMVITSPPYDDLRGYNGYSFEFEAIAKELVRVLKPGGVIIWVVGDSTRKGTESGTSFRQALFFKEIGLNLHDTMIYQKSNYVPLTHNRYEQSFEFMFAFSKGRPSTFNPLRIPTKNAGKVEKYGAKRRLSHGKNHSMRLYSEEKLVATNVDKIAPNIFSYTIGGEKTGHPAVFPEKLARDQISTWTNEGDIVLDPFLGSGTTTRVSKMLGRQYIGIEISDEYVEIAKRRTDEVRFEGDDAVAEAA